MRRVCFAIALSLACAGCGGSADDTDAAVDAAPADLVVVYDLTTMCAPQSQQCAWMFGAPPSSCTPATDTTCVACAFAYTRSCTCQSPENVWNCCIPNGPAVNNCPSGAPPTEGALCCPNVPAGDCVYTTTTCTCVSERWSCSTPADGGSHD